MLGCCDHVTGLTHASQQHISDLCSCDLRSYHYFTPRVIVPRVCDVNTLHPLPGVGGKHRGLSKLNQTRDPSEKLDIGMLLGHDVAVEESGSTSDQQHTVSSRER